MSFYGWIRCSEIKKQDGHGGSKVDSLQITWTNSRDHLISIVIFATTVLFVIIVYLMNDRFDRWTDYVDTFTTGIFFTAMWLMANKKIESWHAWIVANLISVPLYFYKGLGFTALQYVLFLVLAIQGLRAWKEIYNKH